MMAQKQEKKIKSKKRSAIATKKALDTLPKDPMASVFDTNNFK